LHLEPRVSGALQTVTSKHSSLQKPREILITLPFFGGSALDPNCGLRAGLGLKSADVDVILPEEKGKLSPLPGVLLARSSASVISQNEGLESKATSRYVSGRLGGAARCMSARITDLC